MLLEGLVFGTTYTVNITTDGIEFYSFVVNFEEETDPVNCTDVFRTVSINVEYTDSQSVFLDSCHVFWGNRDITAYSSFDENDIYWDAIRQLGRYIIVTDNMQPELAGITANMHFVGYLGGQIICQRDVLVGADRCHVIYWGSESLMLYVDR
jgi:hypothetical protein